MAKEFGWAYVVGSQASGPKGSVQLAGQETDLDHDPNLIWSDEDNALLVSGNIIAHNFEIQNQTKTVFEFEVSGSSIFGDTEDDFHQFTGSIDVTGNVSAVNFYGWGGDLDGVPINYATNFEDNRIVTSVSGNTVNAEENLTFDGTLLSVTGNVEAIEVKANEVSGALGIFEDLESETGYVNELTSSAFSASVANIPNSTFGDIVLTGRIIDASGRVILGTNTAQTEVNTSNTGVQTTISSNTFSSVNSSNAVGMEYAVIDEGIEVGTNAFVAKLGAVGVGTNLPAARLEIYKEGGNQLRLSSIGAGQISSGGGFLFVPQKHHTDIQTDPNGMFSIMPTGQRVGFNTTAPEYSVDILGDTRITGDLIVSGTLSAKVTNFSVSADTLTLGDEQSDNVIMNAGTISIPNGLVIDNELYISSGTIGVGDYSEGSKFEIESPSNQFKVSNSTKNLSVSVDNDSTTLSTNNTTLDIDSSAKVLGELRVGSNGDIVLDNAGHLSASASVSSYSGYFTNLTSSTITNGGTTIDSGSVNTQTLNSYWVNANVIAGRLTTGNQTNIYALGTLSYLNVANATKLQGTLSVGTNSTARRAEIKDSEPQLRLTNTEAVFGISEYQYADLNATANGDLSIEPKSGKVIIPKLNLTNLQQGASSNFLSVDENGNVILAPAMQSGIEVRNRTVISGSYEMGTDDYFVGIQATENLTVTLPDASTLFNGQIFVIKDEMENSDQFTISVSARNNQTVENRASLTLASPGSSINIYTDGQSKFFIM